MSDTIADVGVAADEGVSESPPVVDALAAARVARVALAAAALQDRVGLVGEVLGELAPVDEVRLGLALAHRGVVRGRAQLERMEALTRQLRSDLVDGEEQLRALATEAVRARRPRHVSAVDGERPLRPAADTRPAIVVVSPVSEETQAHLARMGLARPSRSASGASPVPSLPRGVLRRA